VIAMAWRWRSSAYATVKLAVPVSWPCPCPYRPLGACNRLASLRLFMSIVSMIISRRIAQAHWRAPRLRLKIRLKDEVFAVGSLPCANPC
jgi:hypothetical protein